MSVEALGQIERKARGNKSFATLIKLAMTEWSDDDAATWSAAVACYAILALAPMAVLALKVFTFFTSTESAQSQLQSIASQWMGSASGDAIREIIGRASAPGKGKWAAAISLVIAVVSAGGVLAELQQAMNRIWKVKAKAENAAWAFLKARLVSLLVIAIAAFVLLSSVVITSWIEKLSGSVGLSWRYMTWGIDATASAVVATILFALIYRTLPDVQIEWKTTWVGAGIGALLFVIGKYSLALYFKYGSPTSAFGAVGSLAAVLIWVYYSCLIIFFGAELTQVFVKLYGYQVKPSKHARWLKECDETETATPSAYEPGQKPMRPFESRGNRPRIKAPRAVAPVAPRNLKRSRPQPQPQLKGSRSAIILGIGACAAAVGGFFAWRRPRTPGSGETQAVDQEK